MRKIIVAGAGHGGLVAACRLAEAGYDVTVVEKKERNETGHDWHDCIWKPAFDKAEIELPECDGVNLMPYFDTAYVNPAKTVKIPIEGISPRLFFIDRKFLLKMLFERCEKAGVKLIFGREIKGAVVENVKVIGIRTEDGEMPADLVIDAAGVDSPVRSSLPASSGIVSEIPENKMFWAYRAYFENTDGTVTSPVQSIYFYHCNRPGMDWVASDKSFIDVLIGSFSCLTREEIDEALEDFRQEYPNMGKDVIRGGQVAKIPLSPHIPKFIWNGYAAIGDSCSLTEPMSGSGISNCLKAGCILADTVINAGAREFSEELLWKYQYRFLKDAGEANYSVEILREFMASLSGKDIDYFFEKKILTDRELSGMSFSGATVSEIIGKIVAMIPQADKIPGFTKMGTRMLSAKKAMNALPAVYTRTGFEKWRKIYEKI